jgi:hypothetical protein
MTPRVELIHAPDCPNVEDARRVLSAAFVEAGLEPSWSEWDRESPESPPHARRYGSPTILVDGRDVAGVEPQDGSDCCRVYDDGSGGFKGVPSVERISAALRSSSAARRVRNGRGWWRFLAPLPGVGAGVLPVGVCPACWPAYAGILGSLGLGFLLDSAYLLPLTIVLFGLALLPLALRARGGRGPLALGVTSALVVLSFKFLRESDPLVYAGLAGLLIASLWNAWPAKSRGFCPKCARAEPGQEQASART